MEITYDSAKDARNTLKHGVSLADAARFEWGAAMIREDTRKPYAERRFQAVGYIGLRLYVMIYCLRADAVRIISLRRANLREVRHYAKT